MHGDDEVLSLATPGSTGRLVVDRTNLTGVFDVDLRWISRPCLTELDGRSASNLRHPVLVIDHIERPTEDWRLGILSAKVRRVPSGSQEGEHVAKRPAPPVRAQ